MSKYVNRLIAKLLKDKGYNLPCEFYWFEGSTVSIPTRTQYRVENDWNSYTTNLRISAPFISDVVDWLLEKHGVWVEIRFADDYKIFFYDIINTKNLKAITSKSVSHFNSPTKAYEAAIEYCLTKLI